jgi:hypothetical protein
MSIQNLINVAIYTKLSGTALGTLTAGGTASPSVFFEQAPDNQTPPYVVWSFPSELDENMDSHRVKEMVLRAYGVALAPAQAGTLDAAIDTLLHKQSLTFTGTPALWISLWLVRENGYQLISTSEAGIRYYTSGADYRVIVEKG